MNVNYSNLFEKYVKLTQTITILVNYIMKLSTLVAFIGLTSSSFAFSQSAPLPETSNLVKAGEKFVTLIGHQVDIGQTAPNFKVVNESFAPIKLEEFKGKNILISVVPSLDTGVCSIQTKNFNDSVAKLPENTVILTISNDLPFAQKRFCKTEKIDKIQVLSDSVWRDFGEKYGLLIKNMGLLSRSIFIIDQNQTITYKELVPNISQHPNYEKALEEITKLSTSEKN